jgi:hypothetical protein
MAAPTSDPTLLSVMNKKKQVNLLTN